MTVVKERFIQELQVREAWILEALNQDKYKRGFAPEPLREAVYSYVSRPAKRLRPGILFFCCGAVGGREEQARLAAASVEVYHTWTLVHDDIIDNDPKRRGQPTVHEAFRLKAGTLGYQGEAAAEFGRSVAILTGDLQHAWSIRLLADSAPLGVPAPVVLDLINRLEGDVTNGLVEGEALDVIYSKRRIEELSEAEVLKMLELKTGVLYEYAAMAGASIGLGLTGDAHPFIEALGRFARKCGTAFQLQDDILGITGNESKLGKEVGSDIREGKRTTIVLHAYRNAGPQDQAFLKTWLGRPDISEKEIAEIRRILVDYRGIQYTKELAERIAAEALQELAVLPDSVYKDLLVAWANYVTLRDF